MTQSQVGSSGHLLSLIIVVGDKLTTTSEHGIWLGIIENQVRSELSVTDCFKIIEVPYLKDLDMYNCRYADVQLGLHRHHWGYSELFRHQTVK